jgi:transcriptional regulator with XRE-family HTH domain
MKMSSYLPELVKGVYNKTMKSKFTVFMERRYLEWQLQSGGRQSVQAFADYLGISQPLLSMWLNGSTKTPSPKSLYKIAQKLGNEVFDIFGITPPDPLLNYVIINWDKLSPDEQRTIHERIKRFTEINGELKDETIKEN